MSMTTLEGTVDIIKAILSSGQGTSNAFQYISSEENKKILLDTIRQVYKTLNDMQIEARQK